MRIFTTALWAEEVFAVVPTASLRVIILARFSFLLK
jgi:hypothetical protein